MSAGLISRSPDLKKLRDEGYDISVENGHLIISDIPYVNGQKQVMRGTLISNLDLAGDTTSKPKSHVVFWAGEYPCNANGSKITSLVNNENQNNVIREGLVAKFLFSQKPSSQGYSNYYEKMTTYIKMLEGHAKALNSDVTSKTFPVISSNSEESVFFYLDTASSRAGISQLNEKLKMKKVAIVGLGGTGAYVLDLLAKTYVEELHLFDGDDFLQHNAFRSPGAPSKEDLQNKLKKVEYFTEIYSKMHKKIISHAQFVDENNVSELEQMNFVFLCIEGLDKKIIVEYLVEKGIQFIDVGIGMIPYPNEALGGIVRTTTCTPEYHNHISNRINFGDEKNEYSQNIQIADLNALNAVLAVIKWKKICGFYSDYEQEHNSCYTVSTNSLVNEDKVDEEEKDQP